ncbi:hypothetical protein KIPB_005242 [Kipferlia bialata]|uniref:Uncharacterized protein n=2 Tax=Kipferlia bialata TaxID=797122 RepID=A0A9K3GH64_9EUKA|nr:hypothetical protein KIPB_004068 [Kipferlia bialata]GIQ83849.1 hypothetical protein KIPB_005242 [Kipferlia bialata]|eukprot:g4068.t1
MGSLAFATFLSIEVYRSVTYSVRCTPKYEWLYLLLGFGYTALSATSILLAGEVWSCEPGDMLECPHRYISAEASYFGCYIESKWAMLRNLTFVLPCLLLSICCLFCFVGSLLRIRKALASHSKVRASRRLLVITGTTICLIIVPWLYRLVQSTSTHASAPWWIIVYHSLGNGWNGAVNVVLAWWRLGVVRDLKQRRRDGKAERALQRTLDARHGGGSVPHSPSGSVGDGSAKGEEVWL